jgi:hypothetical protein
MTAYAMMPAKTQATPLMNFGCPGSERISATQSGRKKINVMIKNAVDRYQGLSDLVSAGGAASVCGGEAGETAGCEKGGADSLIFTADRQYGHCTNWLFPGVGIFPPQFGQLTGTGSMDGSLLIAG